MEVPGSIFAFCTSGAAGSAASYAGFKLLIQTYTKLRDLQPDGKERSSEHVLLLGSQLQVCCVGVLHVADVSVPFCLARPILAAWSLRPAKTWGCRMLSLISSPWMAMHSHLWSLLVLHLHSLSGMSESASCQGSSLPCKAAAAKGLSDTA